MSKSIELGDELQALKSTVSRLLNSSGDGLFDAAKTDALADQIKVALNELGETLSEGRPRCRRNFLASSITR